MSNYDRNTSFGAHVARKATAEIDQGLRAYMLGVYNYMTLGLGVTGLVALGAQMLAVTHDAAGRLALTPFGQAIYMSPLRWVIIFAPLGFVFFLSARANTISAATARTLFLVFAGVDRPVDVVPADGLHRRLRRAGVLHHGGGFWRT